MWLSKSKLKQGLQCPKSLYLMVHQKHLAKYSQESQKAFSVGNDIGAQARRLFPNGKLIQKFSLLDKIKQSRLEIKTPQTLFEAAFEYHEVPVQVDVLESVPEGWNLIEVKSGLSIKDDYLMDVAIQYYVLQGLKLPLHKIYLWFVNRESTSSQDLFTKIEITIDQIQPLLDQLPALIANFKQVLAQPQIPNIDIGPHCNDPYECPFKNFCWHGVPKTNSIFQLPNFSRKWEAYRAGVIQLDDPRLLEYGVNPEILQAIRNQTMWVDKPALAAILDTWQFPLAVLDFETFQTAIHNYPHSRPYQQIPFQFSLQILATEAAEPQVLDYLHQVDSDPRPGLVQALVAALPPTGTILAYNKKFEEKVLLELSQAFPEHQEVLASAAARLADPWLLLKEHLYHPNFGNSYSLKSVVPALLGPAHAYENLTIKNGLEAQENYKKLITSTNLLEKIKLNQDMRAYCNADTFNLILIYRFLRQILA